MGGGEGARKGKESERRGKGKAEEEERRRRGIWQEGFFTLKK